MRPTWALCIGAWLIEAYGCGGQGYITPQIATDTQGTSSSAPGTQVAPNNSGTSSGGQTNTGGTTPTNGGSGSSGGSGASTCTTTQDTFANFADAALDQWCNGCHAGEWNTVAKASVKQQSLRGQISANLMPPGGGLDATVKSRLLAWLNCPAPLP